MRVQEQTFKPPLISQNCFLTDRLNRTLAHELCHVATWLISGDLKNPHGANFKGWGNKVTRYRPDIVVSVRDSIHNLQRFMRVTNPFKLC